MNEVTYADNVGLQQWKAVMCQELLEEKIVEVVGNICVNVFWRKVWMMILLHECALKHFSSWQEKKGIFS